MTLTSTERQALTAGQADVVLGSFEGAHQKGNEPAWGP
jgi:hypothetical protein